MTVPATTPTSTARPAPVLPSHGTLRPLGLDAVRLTGGAWAHRQEVNRASTLAHIESWLEREGWLGNFDAAVRGGLPADRRGREFSDSEVYKLLEAMAWELGRRPDAELEARFHALVRRVAAAQEPDGYLGTMFGRPGQAARYTDLEWGHELYCQGHLMQAAVARARTGHPDDELVRVARRSADHVCEAFGPGADEGVCGHPEIELGLVELGRALGEPRYVEQAARFVERRGHGTLADIEWGRAYYQDDVPVREAEVLRGHAVRANYLAAAAVDVGVEAGDAGLVEAVDRQWRRAQARRTYLTGGQGSHHQDESFGEDWVLPPDRAYSETCAAVGSVMVAWRLLLARGDTGGYADAIERTLTNVVATSPAHDGRSFYYANTLHQRVPGAHADHDAVSKRAEASLRAPWFDVSCCPPNVARTFAGLAAYVATVDDAGVQLHQYAPCEIQAAPTPGRRVALEVRTGLPADGRVEVHVVEAPAEWTLSLRIPGWSPSARVAVDDGPATEAGPGTVTVPGPPAGSVVRLDLDVTPRFVTADPRVDAVRGCVAVQRGPEVLCLESVDLDAAGLGTSVDDVVVDASVPPREGADGVVVRVARRAAREDSPWPYPPAAPTPATPSVTDAGRDVRLVPYHDWANRGPSTMRVWLPTT